MNSSFIIASFSMFAVCLLSGTMPLYFPWKKNQLQYLLSFGAGVLLATAFLHMLPLTITMLGKQASLYILIGFLIIFIFERFMMVHACGEAEHCPQHPVGISAFLGLSFHTLTTGLAVGAAIHATISHKILFAILLAILSHKIPECIALSTLLLASHWKKTRIQLIIFLYALVGPLGILTSLFSINLLDGNHVLGIALALSAGTFIYIASSDLLPQLHKKDSSAILNLIFFLLGLIILGFFAFSE